MLRMATTSPSAGATATTDMACIAFFFLLCLGKYTAKSASTAPFLISDIQLLHNDRVLNWQQDAKNTLQMANYVTYTFRTQKNGIRSEALGQGVTTHPLCCPVCTTLRQLLHHHQHHTPTHLPLATYYEQGHQHGVLSCDITAALCLATTIVGQSVGFTPNDITARSLQVRGAMALLCADVDPDVIWLLS